MIEATTAQVEQDGPLGFRVRLKFKLATRLSLDRHSLEIQVEGRAVTLKPAWGEMALQESDWIVMTAAGFVTQEAAWAFGQRLRLSVQLAAAKYRIGADCGADKANGGVSKYFRDEVFKQTGRVLRNSVHGLDVFEDIQNIRFSDASGTGRRLIRHEPFVEVIERYHAAVDTLSDTARDILLLLNFALMTSEPVAQTVIAISAVEMIGQDDAWNDAQIAAIEKLRAQVLEDKSLTQAEANEVADAIEKGLFKVSLRQGVKRLLTRIGLPHLMKTWDTLYGERSSLVHGLAPEPGKDYQALAGRAIRLCGHILLTALGKEIEGIDEGLSDSYPIPS